MSKYDIPDASNHEVLLITSKRQGPFIWRPWLFYFILYIACKPWLHMFNILAEYLHIKQSNKNRIVHHLYFFISLLPLLHFFPLSNWFGFNGLIYFFSFIFFPYLSSFLYFYLLHAWIPGFSMFSFFFLFSGQCMYLFPPVSFVFLYKTDLNNSLFQMVIQGHSEQKDESTIFHRRYDLSMWI